MPTLEVIKIFAAILLAWLGLSGLFVFLLVRPWANQNIAPTSMDEEAEALIDMRDRKRHG